MIFSYRWLPIDSEIRPVAERSDSHVYAAALIPLTLLLAGSAAALRVPGAATCPVFPKSNPWNRPADGCRSRATRRELIRSMGLGTGLHADFGSGTVGRRPDRHSRQRRRRTTTPRPRLSFDYADQSDKGPYPLPRNVKIEGARAATATR